MNSSVLNGIEKGLSSLTECQQCNDNITEHDSKPTYTSIGEVTGRVCDSCRLKNVEHARRCQLTACKNRSEGKPTAFRMLPAKFYSLKDGEIKIRLIKQFGITCETKACCNVCYLGLSKAISQLKMMYGDDVMQQDTTQSTILVHAGRNTKSNSTEASGSTVNNVSTSTASNKVTEYQGPKFILNANTTPDFKKQSTDLKTDLNAIDTIKSMDIDVKDISDVKIPGKLDNNLSAVNNIIMETVFTDSAAVVEKVPTQSDEQSATTTIITTTDKTDGHVDDTDTKSLTPEKNIKLEEVSDFDNFKEDNFEDLKFAKSPPAKRQKRRHEDIDFVKFDYFVSCIGCQKVCSVKEAKAAYDYEQGYIGRLCNDCRMKRREENKHCSILGCETPANEVTLRPIPPSINSLKGRLKGRVWSMFGITKDTKLCCKPCWKKITTTVKSKLQEAALKKAANPEETSEDTVTDDSSFTVCLACHHIVKSKNTFCKTIDGVPDSKILCINCLPEEDQKKGTYMCADGKNFKNNLKSPSRSQPNGICQVTNCVSSGTPTVLVSCERLIRRSGEETKVREKFNLAPGNNICCRSCLQRVKWFMIELLKAKHEYDAVPRRVRRPGSKSKSKGNHDKKDDDVFPSPTKSKAGNPQNAVNSQVHRSKDALSSSKSHAIKSQNQHHETDSRKPCKLLDNTSSSSKSIATKEASSVGTSPVVIPQTLPGTTHPPIIQVGGQQLVLSVIHRCDKGTQTRLTEEEEHGNDFRPTFASFVSYLNGSIANKNGIKQTTEKLFNDFISSLDDLSDGHGRQLLVDVCFLKESIMVSSYRKILTSVGEQYKKLSEDNAYERLRLLSLVALHTPNDILKVFFTRVLNDEAIPVNSREIDEARRYAKQFGAGVPISNLGKVAELVSKLDKIDKPSTPDQSSPHCSSPLPRRHGNVQDMSMMTTDTPEETTNNIINSTPVEHDTKDQAKKPTKKEVIASKLLEDLGVSASPDSQESKSKRTRTHFSREERELLELYFEKSPYMSKIMYSEIKTKVAFDKKKVDTWFRNRRSKAKRDEYDFKYNQETENQSEVNTGDNQEASPMETDNESSISDDSGNFKDLDIPEPDIPLDDAQTDVEPSECKSAISTVGTEEMPKDTEADSQMSIPEVNKTLVVNELEANQNICSHMSSDSSPPIQNNIHDVSISENTSVQEANVKEFALTS